jgi:hypothetical protein
MTTTRDWRHYRTEWMRLLLRQTGRDLDHWNARIKEQAFGDPKHLKHWLAAQGVTGYAEQLLVMEGFAYPDWMTASADDLIDRQYADRENLRPVYEAIITAAESVGEIVIQARKGFVSLLTPKRTFARIQPTTKARIDLGLRLERSRPRGRLQPSRMHETMPVQVSLTESKDVDDAVIGWIRAAYKENL